MWKLRAMFFKKSNQNQLGIWFFQISQMDEKIPGSANIKIKIKHVLSFCDDNKCLYLVKGEEKNF